MKPKKAVRIERVRHPSSSLQLSQYQATPKHHSVTDQHQPHYYSTPQQVSTAPPSTVSLPTISQTTSIQEQITKSKLHEIPSQTKWSRRKMIFVGILAFLLLCVLVVVPTVLGILLTQTAKTTTTTTTIASTTTISPINISASWSFDGVTTDLYGVYNGVPIGGATYSVVSSSQPYLGNGQALSLTASSSQGVLVSTPFLNLTYTSFTVEAWIYPTITTGDRGVFGQCQCSTCANQCLYMIIRSGRLYMDFISNDLFGTTTLTASVWYHVAFVYNYQTQQQIMYLNGVQDAIKSNAQPYQGTNGTIQIGYTQVYLSTNYFNGYIDNLNLVTRAKSATEILSDASLIAYYSFDLPSPNLDNGPNRLNGTSMSTITVIGRVNQAMRFTGFASYFQAYGFYQVPYGVFTNKPFSMSMWINPSLITSCTFVQISVSQSTSSCINVIGIFSVVSGSAGQITVQSYSWPTIFGPFVTANVWTHISWTYSSTNGYSLYVNGIRFGTTGGSTYSNSGSIMWLQIGYNFGCSSYYLSSNAYQGSIDEIYIHNRELAASEVYALANP